MKRVAILQSSYIPWKGYFAMIGLVDEFILYDDAQYSKGDWRNRNQIKTQNGTAWLTIPVLINGRFGQRIRETEIADRRWAVRHWRTIQSTYARAPHMRALVTELQTLYETASTERFLTNVNEFFICRICDLLEIETKITRSSDYELRGDRNQRLIGLLQQAGSTTYLSGPSAKSYVNGQMFHDAGISVHWMDYSGFLEYAQVNSPPFMHEVTILDLLINVGVEGARKYMRTSLKDCEAAVFGPHHLARKSSRHVDNNTKARTVEKPVS
jgi:hypothetical protein